MDNAQSEVNLQEGNKTNCELYDNVSLATAKPKDCCDLTNGAAKTMEVTAEKAGKAQLCTLPSRNSSLSTKHKIFRTFCANAAFLAVTLDLGLIGPALPDFELRTGGTTSQLSALFTCRAVLGLVASLAFAPLLDRFNRYMLTSFSLLFNVGFSLAAPWSKSWVPLVALLSPPELFNGLIGMATHVMCITVWKEKSGPSLQTLNLMATIGYTLGPLVIKPFLAHKQNIFINVTDFHNVTHSHDRADVNASHVMSVSETVGSKIEYAYMILAGYELIISILLFAIFVYDGCPWRLKSSEKDEEEESGTKLNNRTFIIKICILYFFFNIFYCGVEVGYAGLLSTFAVKYLGWSSNDGANVTAVLQGSNVVITLLAVFLAKVVRPELMLAFNLLVVILSMVVLSLLAHVHPAVLWASTGGLGVGYATIMPASYTWVNNFMPVTGAFSSAYWSGFFVGFMIIPALTGFLFEKVHPMWLAYMTGICSVAMLVVFTIINFVLYCEKTRTGDPIKTLETANKKTETTKL